MFTRLCTQKNYHNGHIVACIVSSCHQGLNGRLWVPSFPKWFDYWYGFVVGYLVPDSVRGYNDKLIFWLESVGVDVNFWGYTYALDIMITDGSGHSETRGGRNTVLYPDPHRAIRRAVTNSLFHNSSSMHYPCLFVRQIRLMVKCNRSRMPGDLQLPNHCSAISNVACYQVLASNEDEWACSSTLR
jgi:hypothetical protein